jgi:hypothetical protein
MPINDQGEHKEGKPYFVTVTGKNKNAFPLRLDDGSLSFEISHGTFNVTSHELITALKYKMFEIEQIEKLLVPEQTISFGWYVDKFMSEKVEAKKNKDKVSELFSKLLLNSAYGKTSQDSSAFKEYYIRTPDTDYPDFSEGWELKEIMPLYEVYEKPNPSDKYFDVAIGASITGAARAVLMEAYALAERPLYCDTDSLICEGLQGVDLDPYRLGAWDCEGEGDQLAIAGKKLYALFKEGKPQKMASKGARLKPSDIIELCKDNIIEWKNDAPNFSLKRPTQFIKRNIRQRVAN